MKQAEGWLLPARAKLNLVLRITGRRADGYHLLDTLFHAVELHDDLWLAPRAEAGVDLQVTADRAELAVGAGAENLVVRALQRFAEAALPHGGYDVQLHKRIPHGAGLGGGSSDAAAALRLANTLCPTPLDDATLARLGTGLGADVPFFLRGGSAWGRGIGDELAVAVVEPMHFVLLVPPFGCPTADVYKNYAALWKSTGPQATFRAVTGPHTRDSGLRTVFCNDLEPAAERVRPELAKLRRRVVDLGHADVAMTGSGSTLFVAFATADAALEGAERLRALENDGVRIVRTRSAAGTDVPVRAARPGGRS